jgi:hypothetical protein
MNIGDIVSTKWWGDVEILGNSSRGNGKGRALSIKFLNTGNIKNIRAAALRTGCVEDTEYKQLGGKKVGFNQKEISEITAISIGDTFTSKNWGSVKILSIESTKRVEIEFEDTGNRYFVQKHAILDGLVADGRQSIYLSEMSRKQRSEGIKAIDNVVRLLFNIRRESITAKIAKEKEDRLLASKIKAADIDSAKKSIIYNSLAGGYYNISDFLPCGGVEVVFHTTGNKVVVEKKVIGRNAIDTSVFSKEEAVKIFAANYYENNKEAVIAQATKWQKDNPEAVQVRNNKRRARELALGGSYTKAEATKLYEDQDGFCAGCNADLSFEKHLDHIMPLALGGSNSIENLQWLCPFCNLSKNAKHPDVWLKEIQTDAWKVRRNSRKNP